MCVGKYTKRIQEIQEKNKIYRALVILGRSSKTLDTESDIIVDETYAPALFEDVKKVVSSFIGKQKQLPPIFSAKKINGRRAYDLAREGVEFKMKEVETEIHSIEINEYDKKEAVLMTVNCGKGTYIRALAREIGEKLSTTGYLQALQRVSIGEYSIENAFPLSFFQEKE